MLYRDFQGLKLSAMGFGAMRLPLLPDNSVDAAQTEAMVDHAIANGVNYFDTAFPYHGGVSELVLGKALSKYPRDSYYLATKYPGHQIASSYDPAGVFEKQLQKCGVEYFDFYLLHNINEHCIDTYEDPKWGIIDYFVEQRRLGRIKHLGFSAHASADALEQFIDRHPGVFEFCQIQLNYLDWTLQEGERKVQLLTERNIPVWVMESVRGGKLANLNEQDTARLKAVRPDESAAAWGYRWLMDVPGVTMILSGASSLQQMQENTATFSDGKFLNADERALLLELAEGMKDSIPCTACRYCTEGCPMGLDIPRLISGLNDLRISPAIVVSMRLEALPEDKRSSACIGCGACAASCPQKIDIPAAMAELTDRMAKMPKWADMCREREEAAKRLG